MPMRRLRNPWQGDADCCTPDQHRHEQTYTKANRSGHLLPLSCAVAVVEKAVLCLLPMVIPGSVAWGELSLCCINKH